MSISNHWRNKQVGSNLLSQEIACLDFLQKHPTVTWTWLGTQGYFFDYCLDKIRVDTNANGIVAINHGMNASPKQLIHIIDSLLTDEIQCAYFAFNRFAIKPMNDLGLDYPDDIGDTIDLILSHCQKPLARLYHASEVDGRHFVGVHGLDVFVYERD